MSQSSPVTPLVSSQVNHDHDVVIIELVEPDGMPDRVRIVWPVQPTIVDPNEFKGVDSEAISGLYYQLVFQRHDGSRVTAEAPAGRGIRPGEYLFELRERLLAMRSAAGEDQEGDWEDSWPAYPAESHVQGAATDQPKRRSRTVGDWLLLAFFVVFVVLFGLPAFLIVVLDAPPVVGDWLTDHVPFWDEVTDFYDWLFSHAS